MWFLDRIIISTYRQLDIMITVIGCLIFILASDTLLNYLQSTKSNLNVLIYYRTQKKHQLLFIFLLFFKFFFVFLRNTQHTNINHRRQQNCSDPVVPIVPIVDQHNPSSIYFSTSRSCVHYWSVYVCIYICSSYVIE
jgi:hypothetical protein